MRKEKGEAFSNAHRLPLLFRQRGATEGVPQTSLLTLRRLRTFAATPAKPTPSRIIVAGSGTGAASGTTLIVPVPESVSVIGPKSSLANPVGTAR